MSLVLVLVDSLDVASARAIQYARTLTPDELRALRFALDPARTEHLREEWAGLGLTRLPLGIIECPDRRISRAAAEAVASELAGGDTEVSVLIPRRRYRRAWHQLLHDRTAESIADALAGIAHCTSPSSLMSSEPAGVPGIEDAPVIAEVSTKSPNAPRTAAVQPSELDEATRADVPPGCTPIAAIHHRQHVRVGGRVHTQRVRPWADVGSLECTLVDGTGAITVVFMGRRQVPGINLGTHMVVEGQSASTVGTWQSSTRCTSFSSRSDRTGRRGIAARPRRGTAACPRKLISPGVLSAGPRPGTNQSDGAGAVPLRRSSQASRTRRSTMSLDTSETV